ncbi:MAG: hypothetical protein WC773_04065 [Patescibacteria group bacterium]
MRRKRVILSIAYIVIAAVVVYAIVYTKGFGLFDKKDSGSGWSAVFLTNGQVYFGHLKGQNNQFSTLSDIYYLQVEQQSSLQPEATKSTVASPSASSNLSLIKLGNELHGPKDQMTINRDQILFIEEMKTGSKVVTAIEAYIKNPTATPTP